MRARPSNHAQLCMLQHLKKRLNHVRNFYFAGALLDVAYELIKEKLNILSNATNAYQLYHLIQPFEALYFRAAVSKTCISHFTVHTTIEE